MSVESFLNSANILYDNKKYDEALCLVCIAIDACSSKQYPNKGNAQRYKLFLKNIFRPYVGMDFQELMQVKFV